MSNVSLIDGHIDYDRMKSVLISIQPYWVFLIIAKKMGWNIDKKTVEVRKNRPKDENWDKIAKIYCSKDKKSFAKIPKEYQPFMEQFLGKVIGEFVCDDIGEFKVFENGSVQYWNYHELVKTCLTYEELANYIGKNNNGYGWHISNLVIYDKPRELREFIRICPEWEKEEITEKCLECEHLYRSPIEHFIECDYEGELPITRPPQSWCYIESEIEGK